MRAVVSSADLESDLSTHSSVKREIAHLCRDVTPPPRRASETNRTQSPSHPPESEVSVPQPQPVAQPLPVQNRLPTSLYADPNFPPAWPLLPDTEGPVTFGDGGGPSDVRRPEAGGNWATGDDTELGALT